MKSPVNSKSARVGLLKSDELAALKRAALLILPAVWLGLLWSTKLLPRPVVSNRIPFPSSNRQYAIRQSSRGDPLVGVGVEAHCDIGMRVSVGVDVAVEVEVKVGVGEAVEVTGRVLV